MNLMPVSSSVAALNAKAPRCSGLPDTRLPPDEFTVYELLGRVTLVRPQDDLDYHVVLADLQDPSQTIVTEIADPGCSGAISSPYRTLLAGVRSAFDAVGPSTWQGRTVRLRGVGFYDFNHGQTGRSRSCIELHPVLSIEAL